MTTFDQLHCDDCVMCSQWITVGEPLTVSSFLHFFYFPFNMSNLANLAPFIPRIVFKYLAEAPEWKLIAPKHHEFSTVVLFCDVSGFTKLSESLAQKGPVGAEDLGFYLNRYMERLVRIIARCGGDIFKFAGDAMIVLWPPPDGDSEHDEKEIGLMVHRAAQVFP